MLLLRWSYFAQPVPNAEVVSLSPDVDLIEDDAEYEDGIQQPKTTEDDPVFGPIFDDFDEDEDADLGQIALPTADDFLPLAPVEDVEEEELPDEHDQIALPEGDDFIALFNPDDTFEDDDEEAYPQFNFDFTPAIVDLVAILLAAEDALDEDDADPDADVLEFFDFGNPPPAPDLTEIIGMLVDDTALDEEFEFTDDEPPLLSLLPDHPITAHVVEWLLRARRRGNR